MENKFFVCKRCGKTLSSEQFYICSRGYAKDRTCRSCAKIRDKKRYDERGWETARTYYAERGGREKFRARYPEWHRKLKERFAKCPWEATLRYIKCRVRGKGFPTYFGIKNELTAGKLELLWHRDGAAGMEWPTIDRIDPKGHYTFENCRYVEHRENSGRSRRRVSLS